MNKPKLGDLSEQDLLEMTDFMASEEYDRMPAADFFDTLRAMDEADTPERVVIRGHLENASFVPDAVEGAVLDGRCIRIDRKAIVEVEVERRGR